LGLAYLEEARTFGTEEIDLLTRFAQLASIALDNARLYNASQQELTERARAEEAVSQLTETLEGRVAERTAQLQEAVRSREVLLSVVSHDLRNLLSAVKGSTKLLLRIAQPAEQGLGVGARGLGSSTELQPPPAIAHTPDPQPPSRPDPMLNGLARIDSAVNRMNNLIGELLDFGRGQAGQPLELLRQQTDLVALAQRLAGEHQHYAERHTIRVEAKVPALSGLWDPTRLERVLDNLITNAIKYSPKGGEIVIEVRREECATGRERSEVAVLAVRDQGIGIPEDDLPDIFNWYARAGNVSGRISGTGIGLVSARLVVEQHGGTIDVRSKEGEGTTFTVRLPVALERWNVGTLNGADDGRRTTDDGRWTAQS
jgi:signal transduction histidine kinase